MTESIVLRTHSIPLNSINDRLTDPLFEEGLYLSSPDFYEAFLNREKENNKEKIDTTLLKYWLRCCTRCTPFGTFAGSKVIPVTEDKTFIQISTNEKHTKFIRLDTLTVSVIVKYISNIEIVKKQIRFHPNNSIYIVANKIRFVEYTILKDSKKYALTAIEQTPLIETILKQSQNGILWAELVELIINTEKVNYEEANNFVIEIINSQLLVSELEPTVTGNEPLSNLLLQLKNIKGVEEIFEKLSKIQKLLKSKICNISTYKEIENILLGLIKIENIPKINVQVDLFLNTINATINKLLIDKIINQCDDLKVFSKQYQNKNLTDFKKRFYEKYEEQEISLAIALDADVGVGYASFTGENIGNNDLINSLHIENKEDIENIIFCHIQRFSMSKYISYLKENKSTIEITETEILDLKKYIKGLDFSSNSTYIFGELLGNNIDVHNFTLVLNGIGGSSAANLLGRFTQGDT
jgi:hypothetical protein